jgi:hypothetical protein
MPKTHVIVDHEREKTELIREVKGVGGRVKEITPYLIEIEVHDPNKFYQILKKLHKKDMLAKTKREILFNK